MINLLLELAVARCALLPDATYRPETNNNLHCTSHTACTYRVASRKMTLRVASWSLS
jgi:hypothetical protein